MMMRKVAGMRRLGAASLDLAWVAAGRLDGYWEAGLSPWDMAAGIMMVREAGGIVRDLKGGSSMFETKGVIAGNDLVVGQMLKVLKEAQDAQARLANAKAGA